MERLLLSELTRFGLIWRRLSAVYSTVYREFDVFSGTTESQDAESESKPPPAENDKGVPTFDLSQAYTLLRDSEDLAVVRRVRIWNDLTKSREWTDASGEFTVVAQYVTHDKKSVTIRKEDGSDITVPTLST